VDRCEPEVHLRKSAVDELRMFTEVLCESFAFHRLFQECDALVECLFSHADTIAEGMPDDASIVVEANTTRK
jgi:hypothetical protein